MRGQTRVPQKFRMWERDTDQKERISEQIEGFDIEYYKQSIIA